MGNLRKITVGNPLSNFHLWDDIERYEALQTDEEIAAFYQEMLSKYENRPMVSRFIFDMINYSCNGEIEIINETTKDDEHE
jgi:hypothetical protein